MNKHGIVGETLVDGRLMRIYSMDREHSLGHMNGAPANWWLEYKPLSSGDNVRHIPWLDIGAHRPCFRIEVTESNSTKEKWGDTQIRGAVTCRIFVNNLLAYSFVTRDVEYAMARAMVIKTELMEHPISSFLMGHGTLTGRRVWYKGQPGIIKEFIEGGDVSIEPDGIPHFNMKEPWMTEDHELEWAEEWEELRIVMDDVLSKKIWWFRDE
jgi:hypothetical protein